MKHEAERAPLTIARLDRGAEDLDAIDALALATFGSANVCVREELERPWNRSWVARRAGRPLAFLVAWHVADELHVLHLATAEAARRGGVGTALMEAALAYARTEHVRIALLELRRSNEAALRLYEKLGFTVTGVRARYYSDNDEDALEMVLALQE